MTMTANRTYDPATDSYRPTTTTFKTLWMDSTKAFADRSEASEKVKAGDMALVMSVNSGTPDIGTEFTVASGMYTGRWSTIDSQREQDSWLLQLRRL